MAAIFIGAMVTYLQQGTKIEQIETSKGKRLYKDERYFAWRNMKLRLRNQCSTYNGISVGGGSSGLLGSGLSGDLDLASRRTKWNSLKREGDFVVINFVFILFILSSNLKIFSLSEPQFIREICCLSSGPEVDDDLSCHKWRFPPSVSLSLSPRSRVYRS